MYVFAANNTTNKRQLQQLDIPPSDIFQIDLETHLSQPPFIISDPSLYKYDEDLFNILVFCLSNYKNSRACIGFPFFKDSSSNIKYFCTPNNSNDIKSKIFKFRQNDDDDMIKKYNTLSPTSNQQGFEDLLMFISYYYRLFLNIQKKISFAMVRNQQYTQGLPFMKAYVHEIQQSISNDCLNLHSKKSPNPEQTCKDIANYAIQKYLRDNICLENEECVTNLYRTSKLYKIQTKVHDVIAKDPMNPYSLPLYQQQILRDGRHEEFKFVKFIQALNTARYVIAQDVFVKGEEVQIPKNKDQGLKDDTDQDQQHRCSPLFANPTGKGKYKNKSKKEEFNSKYKDFSNNFCKNQYEPDVLSHFNDDLFVQVLPLVSDIDPFLKVFQVVEQFSPSLDWGIHDKRIDLELFKQDGYE